MAKITGVRFKSASKSYYFDPQELALSIGTKVIVETARGADIGEISIPPMDVDDEKVKKPLKPVIRIATEEDNARAAENREREQEAFRICKTKIAEHELPMKLIEAEYTFDRNKLLFYFTADGRVDFRSLVKDLAGIFKTRIELRQVGVRDETKILGGIGICGRELCCRTYLSSFAPVSIKMAKEQNLSLNPTKISGVCGRLMCCLNNENETYEFLNKTLPRSGDFATNADGEVGVITNVNILKQSVVVLFEEDDTREIHEYPVDEVGITKKRDGRPAFGENLPENAAEIIARREEERREQMDAFSFSDFISGKSEKESKKRDRGGRGRRGRDRRRNDRDKNEKNDRRKNGGAQQEKNAADQPQKGGKGNAGQKNRGKGGKNAPNAKNNAGNKSNGGNNANSGGNGGKGRRNRGKQGGAQNKQNGRPNNPENKKNAQNPPENKKNNQAEGKAKTREDKNRENRRKWREKKKNAAKEEQS